MSKLKKEFFMKHPEKHMMSIIVNDLKKRKKRGGYISKKQREIFEILKDRFPDSKLNYPLKTKGGLYFSDIGIPFLKLDIEYDCWYWHDEKKDKIRDKHIRDIGWRVIRLKDQNVDKLEDGELLNHILILIESKLS